MGRHTRICLPEGLKAKRLPRAQNAPSRVAAGSGRLHAAETLGLGFGRGGLPLVSVGEKTNVTGPHMGIESGSGKHFKKLLS